MIRINESRMRIGIIVKTIICTARSDIRRFVEFICSFVKVSRSSGDKYCWFKVILKSAQVLHFLGILSVIRILTCMKYICSFFLEVFFLKIVGIVLIWIFSEPLQSSARQLSLLRCFIFWNLLQTRWIGTHWFFQGFLNIRFIPKLYLVLGVRWSVDDRYVCIIIVRRVGLLELKFHRSARRMTYGRLKAWLLVYFLKFITTISGKFSICGQTRWFWYIGLFIVWDFTFEV